MMKNKNLTLTHTLPLLFIIFSILSTYVFAPSNNLPVSPDYILGPGDSFAINLWEKLKQHIQQLLQEMEVLYCCVFPH